MTKYYNSKISNNNTLNHSPDLNMERTLEETDLKIPLVNDVLSQGMD